MSFDMFYSYRYAVFNPEVRSVRVLLESSCFHLLRNFRVLLGKRFFAVITTEQPSHWLASIRTATMGTP
jgi:hypothetical protein